MKATEIHPLRWKEVTPFAGKSLNSPTLDGGIAAFKFADLIGRREN